MKIPLSEKVWAMDIKWPWLIVGTADRKIHMYNMTNAQTPFRVCFIFFIIIFVLFCFVL